MAVPALDDGTIYYHSRMLGILPEYQNRGLGLRLKLFQRSIARRRGISHIRWTFDPLQSRNAWLNVVKLGCTSREYLPNLYGKNSSLFNAGLETDRLIAEWRIDRSPKCNAPPDRLPPPTIESETGADGFRRPTGIRRVIGPRISLEIPENIDALKRSSLALARSWRLATRAAFQSAFRRGYVADGFLRRNDNGERRCFYLLSKRSR
ncbi:MAG: hypothetical protein A2Z34_11715 [Planctomycetes bacterium RBG_16_59_8]|nr:MAG: hypothetical protein A2Z34_11715 [Planctomycetes bacterium RBG_16_59_8]